MKERRIYIAIMLLMGVGWASCEDKQAAPPPPPVVYPDNTIYATMSESIIANGTYVFTPQHVKFSGDTLSIYAVNITDSGGTCEGTMVLGMEVYARQTGVYVLNNYNQAFNLAYGFCSLNSFSYYTDSIHVGSINITLLDTLHHFVSGTFRFTPEMQRPSQNEGTETISDGHFTNITL